LLKTDPDEILDLLYEEIHNFLIAQAGEDLGHDIIDINIETSDNGELTIEINLALEIRAFSTLNAKELAEKAIAHGIKIADKVCPSAITVGQHLKD
jgi:hypothetical protein